MNTPLDQRRESVSQLDPATRLLERSASIALHQTKARTGSMSSGEPTMDPPNQLHISARTKSSKAYILRGCPMVGYRNAHSTIGDTGAVRGLPEPQVMLVFSSQLSPLLPF